MGDNPTIIRAKYVTEGYKLFFVYDERGNYVCWVSCDQDHIIRMNAYVHPGWTCKEQP